MEVEASNASFRWFDVSSFICIHRLANRVDSSSKRGTRPWSISKAIFTLFFFLLFFGVGFYSSCTVFFLLQGVLIFCCHSFSLHCRFHKKKSYMYTWLGKEPFTTELARTARDLRPCSNVDTLSTSVPSWIIWKIYICISMVQTP